MIITTKCYFISIYIYSYQGHVLSNGTYDLDKKNLIYVSSCQVHLRSPVNKVHSNSASRLTLVTFYRCESVVRHPSCVDILSRYTELKKIRICYFYNANPTEMELRNERFCNEIPYLIIGKDETKYPHVYRNDRQGRVYQNCKFMTPGDEVFCVAFLVT